MYLQSFNVVEYPEFCDLLLYLGKGNIQDKNLPHHTKLTEMILKEFQTEYHKVKTDLKKALGCISHTTDLWSDPNLDSFMALTAHFMAHDLKGVLVFKTHLVAVHFITGAHTGAHLGQEFLKITDELETSNKVWVFFMFVL
ncbi:hypothetical protein BDR07DRAFT_1300624 [Suillus spraguei]|nr:hypothetical protein BDR07DRAFT_1300624 [Suillus spraguei]